MNLLRRSAVKDVGQVLSVPSVHIFCTPGLAHWLDPQHTFLSDLGHNLFNQPRAPRKPSFAVDFVVAVVDRLPGPSQDELPPVGPGKVTSFIAPKSFTTSIPGFYEGFAIQLPSLTSSEYDSTHVDLLPDQSRRIILHHSSQSRSWAIALQPANTIFSNGSEATMFRTRMEYHQTGFRSEEGSTSFTRRIEVSEIRITHPKIPNQSLFIPVSPLTKPRRVTSSMGNVVSQLQDPQNPNQEMPASTELEPAVSKFLSDHGTASAGVFAYIKNVQSTLDVPPKEETQSALVEAGDTNVPPITPGQVDWATALQSGTLRKVTGGGGGWGKKRGLLSFDAVTDLNETTESSYSFDHDYDASPMSRIAKAGDTIQFFATLPFPPKDAASRLAFGMTQPSAESRTTFRHPEVSEMIQIGKIPPAAEHISKVDTEKYGRWSFGQNFLGLLSEGNVSIFNDKGKEEQEIVDDSMAAASAPVGRTRLNAPFSVLTNTYLIGHKKKRKQKDKDKKSPNRKQKVKPWSKTVTSGVGSGTPE